MITEIKTRYLKKMKQDNALNFSFFLSKTKRKTKKAPAENQVTAISSSILNWAKKVAAERSLASKGKTIDWINNKKNCDY